MDLIEGLPMHTFLNRVAMLAMEAKPKKSVWKWIVERVNRHLCLLKGCDGKSETRGLCGKHYRRWTREFKEIAIEDRLEFESRSISDGKILGSHAVSEIRNPSPFGRAG